MTKIFKSYSDFLAREDSAINGVSETFAAENPNWEKDNESNEACWNCWGCSDCSRCSDCWGCWDCSDCSDCSRCSDCWGCSDCSDCSRCSDCWGLKGASPVANEDAGFKVPVIENIHQKVYEAVNRPNALDMTDWHTCDTTHCRAGWVVHLAGAPGYELEKKTTTLFAAMQIYHKSSPDIPVSPARFFDGNEKALQNIKECAEKEMAAAK
jgi:hypothetical protein